MNRVVSPLVIDYFLKFVFIFAVNTKILKTAFKTNITNHPNHHFFLSFVSAHQLLCNLFGKHSISPQKTLNSFLDKQTQPKRKKAISFRKAFDSIVRLLRNLSISILLDCSCESQQRKSSISIHAGRQNINITSLLFFLPFLRRC